MTVSNPQKAKGYITYTIKSTEKSTGSEATVQRRYNDFLWLLEVLQAEHPSCVIPPLPEKSLTNKYSVELLEQRTRELSIFIKKTVQHPLLVSNPTIRDFLFTEDGDAFAAKKKEYQPKVVGPTTLPTGIMGTMKTGISTISFAFGATKAEDPDPWFATQMEELDRTEAALTKVLMSSFVLAREYRELAQCEALNNASLGYLAKVLDGFDGASASRIGHVNHAAEQRVKLSMDMGNYLEHEFHDCIKDYIREVNSLRFVCEKRVDYVRAYTVALANTKDPKSKEDEERFNKIKTRALAELDAFSKTAKADMVRAAQMRKKELLDLVTALASFSAESAQQMYGPWNSALTASISDDLNSVIEGSPSASTGSVEF